MKKRKIKKSDLILDAGNIKILLTTDTDTANSFGGVEVEIDDLPRFLKEKSPSKQSPSSSRLALERYIQTWIENMDVIAGQNSVTFNKSKFFRLSYVEQLKVLATCNRLAFPNFESVSNMVENADNGGVYKIADKFGEHLHKTNLNIPISVLPRPEERLTIYIQFPKSISYQSGGFTFDHAILDIGSPEELLPVGMDVSEISDISSYLMYRICAIPSAEDIDGTSYFPSMAMLVPKSGECEAAVFGSLVTGIVDGTVDVNQKSIMALIKKFPAKSIPTEIVEFCLKVLLYIHTGDPDLQPEAKRYPCATNKEKYLRHIENHCPFTVHTIGYSFHERHRHIDSTVVTGHFRWQPYGPKLSKVKLIWIDEHSRNYKKED